MKLLINYLLKISLSSILLILIGSVNLTAQEEQKFTLSGHVKDFSSGEELIAATVFVKELETGNTTNVYGFYSLTIPKGTYQIVFSYLGFEDKTIAVTLDQNIRQDIDLVEAGELISEITIVAEEKDKNVQSTEMSRVTVDVETVKQIPALFGEVDIIKAIQLLPGVKTVGEGTSGFYVRGGNADQNLVLLDEAPLYNASHLMGFFSSFNPDAIKDMNLYKGAIAPRYGGRLSSVLDVRMKEGNSKKIAGAAGIGSIMTRLSLEAPIGKKGSFMVAGRRSYLDIMAKAYLKTLPEEKRFIDDFTFYFYDLNAKGNYRLGENDRIFISGYLGRDIIAEPDFGFDVDFGNQTTTLRWNHIFSPKLFSNISAYYSKYDYALGITQALQKISWKASLEELSGKADFTYYLSPKHTLRFGAQAIQHDLNPGDVTVSEKDSVIATLNIDNNKSLENAIYISDEWEMNDKIKVDFGVRASSLHNLGPQTHINMDEEYVITDSTKYEKGFYHSYFNIEPRLGLKYSIDDKQSIKASYNRTAQYIQQASNGNTATPLDIWFSSTPNVKPQLADQYALGYFRNFMDNQLEFSAEVYYKNFINAIDFKERAQILLNENLEGELRVGSARAYGLELMLRKDIGKLTGWVSYTYSKIEKKIDQVNDNNWYNAKYDKPHDLSIVLSYEFNKRLSASTNFVYSTGSAVTFPTGKYDFHGTIIPVYSERNGERLPDYHRLDCSITLQSKTHKKKNPDQLKRFQSQWVLSVYNVYDRRNAFAVNFRQDNETNLPYAEKSAIFSIVPAITYNVKF